MGYFIGLAKQILRDMWAWKLRSFLAIFGIMWGTISVVMLLALGTGFRTASEANMFSIADGTFFVTVGKTSKSFDGYPQGTPVNIKASAIMELQRKVPEISMISPLMAKRTSVKYGNKTLSKELFGVSDQYGPMQKIDLVGKGRFINRLDVENRNHVVVIGNKLKSQLFGDNTDALQQKVYINNVAFTVIGVINPSVYDWNKNKAIIPYTVYINMYGNQTVPFFIVLPNPETDPKIVQASIHGFLAKKYHFARDDDIALRVLDTSKFFQFIRWFFVGLQIFLGICGGLTLAVGSLGVANIMFLIVSERTREIGIRMAIGAADWQILLQIIIEALIIIAVGGLVGLGLSFITVEIMQHISLPDWLGKPHISYVSVLVTFIILGVLGLVAGYFPARRAAKMDPVEALGY